MKEVEQQKLNVSLDMIEEEDSKMNKTQGLRQLNFVAKKKSHMTSLVPSLKEPGSSRVDTSRQ